MSIFRRGSKAPGRHAADRDGAVPQRPEATDGATEEPRERPTDTATDTATQGPQTPREPLVAGPYDEADAPGGGAGRLDLGALRVVGVPGMEVRLEVEEESQQVVGVTAVLGESAVQLQAFAAPRSAGIWDEIRSEIAESILARGGTAEEARGELGTELRTRMPSSGPDGRTVFAPARFVGVDGSRWFLRAVFSGRAAIDEEAAVPLMQLVRGTVVVRGQGPMAPRELLPLQLPQQPGGSPGSGPSGPAGEGPRSTADLSPFERGPEITEVR